MIATNLQGLYAFLSTVYGGVAIGLCYDIIVRVFFKYVEKKGAADALFLASSFVVMLTVLFGSTNMQLRGYLFLGFLCGWAVYFVFVSPLVLALCRRLEHVFLSAEERLELPLINYSKRFALKNKDKIAKVNLMIGRVKNIPKEVKISYNKYVKYVFKRKNIVEKEAHCEKRNSYRL